jgi:uncharacterized protein involved in propanediol utilization
MVFRILGSLIGGDEEIHLLGYNALQSVKSQPTCQRNIWPPFSRSIVYTEQETRILLATCAHAGSLLGIFFDPQGRVDMFFRNVR